MLLDYLGVILVECQSLQWLSCRILNTPVLNFISYRRTELNMTFCHSLSPNTKEIKSRKPFSQGFHISFDCLVTGTRLLFLFDYAG